MTFHSLDIRRRVARTIVNIGVAVVLLSIILYMAFEKFNIGFVLFGNLLTLVGLVYEERVESRIRRLFG